MRGEHTVGEKKRKHSENLKTGLTFNTSTDPYREKEKLEKADAGSLNIRTQDWVQRKQAEGDIDSGLAAGQTGTSIFDPVLCELAYRWFSPPGGSVLDPFAGGSVRGIVAAKVGRKYTGVDLSDRQIAANRKQAAVILSSAVGFADSEDFTPELTPVEKRLGVWFKRDDLYCVAGVRGGKVRTCMALAAGATGLVTAGSRSSPQVNIVAQIARRLGIPARVHTPTGVASPEVKAAIVAGAKHVQHKAGYNNVIIARAREDAAATGFREIPFGMECAEAIKQTRAQVANIPVDAKRLVVSVGSGMSLAGILWGLLDRGLNIPVVGVCVGADPVGRLDEYAPKHWKDLVTLVQSGSDYHAPAGTVEAYGLKFDSVYEAKCLPVIEPGDCFWVVGIRQTEATKPVDSTDGQVEWIVGDSTNIAELAPGEYDFIFSCPPYGDLEVYSEDPADISNMKYADFLIAYRKIIAAACGLLKPDRFACFVVGDFRDKKGNYRNFPGDTIAAFMDQGLTLYNTAVLITAAGSLPIRVGKQFTSSRKLGKTHQDVLIFLKGDAKRATEACGPVEVADVDPDSPTNPEA